ncbi:PAS/PAC sensor signal transduction histidine kinase [Ruegeria sp. TM1040]|uniref:sensor histidine kinase n=1 Tax=Ruegeria sp. (strain TM1040) TaxID=292414 RepID=UPI0000555417|nr:PAS domain-containing sensor histidine kinase [Ruegeria sp. TM1040]ABF63563.1 PAS/PAC sensor signal transduction histidine kinase [Ruegeria sp. TM1040]
MTKNAQAVSKPTSAKHYLEEELDALFQQDAEAWRFVQQGSLDGVWYWDLKQPDKEWMSPEMWALFGIDPTTKRHDPSEWQDIIFKEDLEVALKNFEKHCADPNHPYDQIVRYRHADGSTVWVRCRGIAIRDETGKPIRMLGAHNDLTAVKLAEERANTACRETAAANEELRSFAYSISHDLKSPTNTMDMLLREIAIADDGGMSEEQRELLHTAQETANRMRSLVDDMLDYTRLIGEEPVWESVSLYDTGTRVRDMLGSLVAETGAKISIDENLPNVSGNPTQLRVLLQNLIENAIKYRDPSRPPVVVVSKLHAADTNETGFSVADNGLGIAEGHQDRVFEMFKRLHREDEVAGAGLGLTLCRRVALNHGGDIQVSSKLGQGTTFTVSFPERNT